MSYIDRNLVPDEKILFRTKKSLIIFLVPILWILITLFFYANSSPMIARIGFIPALATFVVWMNTLLNYFTSEFAVTNKRIVMKEGFFFRHIQEVQLHTISNVSVTQSLLGQVLNYGTLWINTFGGDSSPFREIACPAEFQKQLQTQLNQTEK